MGENPRFERPTTANEEHKLVLDRSKYLLEHIGRQNEQLGEDNLTGLKTRKFLIDKLDHSFNRADGKTVEHRREGISVIFIDLDHFKGVNDTLGHAGGDKVLKKVAKLLKGALRETDILARYGGDEFVALLPNTNKEHATVVANHLRASLDNDLGLKDLGVTASLGVCSTEASTATDSESFIHHADLAAYVAKQEGKNRVVVYEEGMEMKNDRT